MKRDRLMMLIDLKYQRHLAPPDDSMDALHYTAYGAKQGMIQIHAKHGKVFITEIDHKCRGLDIAFKPEFGFVTTGAVISEMQGAGYFYTGSDNQMDGSSTLYFQREEPAKTQSLQAKLDEINAKLDGIAAKLDGIAASLLAVIEALKK